MTKEKKKRDAIFARPLQNISDFVFDEAVADVFPDMIKRSVPGYETLLTMIGLLTRRYAQADSALYDLGCSLGAATLAMRHNIRASNCRIVAVDNSPAMAKRCRDVLASDRSPVPVDVICADIRAVAIRQASMVALNFTLQFLRPEDRLPLLSRVCSGLLPGGALVLSEKIAFDSTAQDEFHRELHHFFKKENGYSDLEISQKRAALERVLIAESRQVHLTRLREAGFQSAELWFQCFNFVSFLAVK